MLSNDIKHRSFLQRRAIQKQFRVPLVAMGHVSGHILIDKEILCLRHQSLHTRRRKSPQTSAAARISTSSAVRELRYMEVKTPISKKNRCRGPNFDDSVVKHVIVYHIHVFFKD